MSNEDSSICPHALEHGCIKLTCANCDYCPQPVNPEKDSGIYFCDICERNHIISLLGKYVQLTTTRTPREIEKLSQSARNECRMYAGVVTQEYISDKEIKHDVCIDERIWVTILDGHEVRNVYVNKTA